MAHPPTRFPCRENLCATTTEPTTTSDALIPLIVDAHATRLIFAIPPLHTHHPLSRASKLNYPSISTASHAAPLFGFYRARYTCLAPKRANRPHRTDRNERQGRPVARGARARRSRHRALLTALPYHHLSPSHSAPFRKEPLRGLLDHPSTCSPAAGAMSPLTLAGVAQHAESDLVLH